MNTAMKTSSEVEIRKTPVKHLYDLAQILEIGHGWKELMAIIPNPDGDLRLKYTVEHMRMIEEASAKMKRTCSEILLDEWGTSGKNRPRVKDLLSLLTKAQLYRAAEYVSFNILNETVLERPAEGPAAKVEIPEPTDISVKPTAPSPSSNIMVQPCAPPASCITPSLPDVPLTALPKNSSTEYTGECEVTRRICQELSLRNEERSGVRVFNFSDLQEGTNNFNDSLLLGRGGFGSVYLIQCGHLGSLAVKRLFSEGAVIPNLAGDQFTNELLIVTGLSHPNILELIGYSCDGPELCLVYPYIVNGSLQDRLECKGGTDLLPWPIRLQIAIETAEGLCYLHSQVPKPLVHRDIKSANVLLGHNFHVKIADFGLVRYGASGTLSQSVATTTVLGTSAYMAPEAFRGDVSVKMDVFSFGVVLLELVTGLPPLDEARSGCDLASHVDEIDDFDLLVDMRLDMDDTEPARLLFDLAQKCLLEKKLRPLMATVLESLHDIAPK